MMTQEQMDQMNAESQAEYEKSMRWADALRNDINRVLFNTHWGRDVLGGSLTSDLMSAVRVVEDRGNGGRMVEICDQVCISRNNTGYYVYYWKSDSGSRYSPPETWDEEIVITNDRAEAITRALAWFMYWDAANILTPGADDNVEPEEQV